MELDDFIENLLEILEELEKMMEFQVQIAPLGNIVKLHGVSLGS